MWKRASDGTIVDRIDNHDHGHVIVTIDGNQTSIPETEFFNTWNEVPESDVTREDYTTATAEPPGDDTQSGNGDDTQPGTDT